MQFGVAIKLRLKILAAPQGLIPNQNIEFYCDLSSLKILYSELNIKTPNFSYA